MPPHCQKKEWKEWMNAGKVDEVEHLDRTRRRTVRRRSGRSG